MCDPLFGELLFVKTPDATKSYWEGSGVFPATGRRIEYFIRAGEPGPKEDQRSFYRRLAEKYNDLMIGVVPILESSYRDWLDKAESTDVSTKFALSSLSVPEGESNDAEWELSFDCAEDKDHLFSVQMRGWKATGDVSIDG
jgi:hypothetical protein